MRFSPMAIARSRKTDVLQTSPADQPGVRLFMSLGVIIYFGILFILTFIAFTPSAITIGTTTRLICPTGNFPNSLSSPVRKNISLRRLVETVLLIGRPALTRGALRGRHGRWERDAVDAAASAHVSAQTNGADADGEVVWS